MPLQYGPTNKFFTTAVAPNVQTVPSGIVSTKICQVVVDDVNISGANYYPWTSDSLHVGDLWNPVVMVKFTNGSAQEVGASSSDGPMFSLPPYCAFQVSYDSATWQTWGLKFYAAQSGVAVRSAAYNLPEGVKDVRAVLVSGGMYGSLFRMEVAGVSSAT